MFPIRFGRFPAETAPTQPHRPISRRAGFKVVVSARLKFLRDRVAFARGLRFMFPFFGKVSFRGRSARRRAPLSGPLRPEGRRGPAAGLAPKCGAQYPRRRPPVGEPRRAGGRAHPRRLVWLANAVHMLRATSADPFRRARQYPATNPPPRHRVKIIGFASSPPLIPKKT